MTTAAKLLKWYDKNGRDLPWRKTRDPYKILVSEIMLQQTQVSRGLIFYDRWLKQFPDWEALANASNADVIRAWAGLGYNRRALMLRDIARQIVENSKHQAPNNKQILNSKLKIPKTEKEWVELKGIGPYTSAAVAAFANHERTMPIDTNIRRVLGRVLLGKPFPQPSDDARIRRAALGRSPMGEADAFLPRRGRFYDVPQAIFDLATMICTKSPSCATCPLRADCPAAAKFLSGTVRVPKAMVKKAVEKRHRDKPHPDRIYRGRILALVRTKKPKHDPSAIGQAVDPDFNPMHDQAWIAAMLERLERDQLILKQNGRLTLPG